MTPRPVRYLSSFLCCAFVGTSLVYSLAMPAGAEEDETQCERRVAGVGFPRPSRQLAEISAIGNWLEAAGQLSADMPAWHRARGKSMKCEEIGTLGRISCIVAARPCFEAESEDGVSATGSVR